jgi:hypothetical protein
LIEELSLRSVDNGSELQPVSVGIDPEYLATYVQALVRVHEEMIPILQRLVPPQFSDLVKTALSNWIPSPGVKKYQPPRGGFLRVLSQPWEEIGFDLFVGYAGFFE